MNKEELIGKLHMIYAGDRNALEEMVGYYDGLKEVVELLKKESQKYKEAIDKAMDIINDYLKEDYSIYTENEIEVDLIVKLKNILKEVS